MAKFFFSKKSPYTRVKYRDPEYLIATTKQRFGDDIFVLGATFEDLIQFWNHVEQHAISIGHPYEVGRTVVDIDSKCHINTSSDSNDEPDAFKITSSTSQKQTKTSSTSYQLQLTRQSENQIGANLHFKIGGPAFFNQASGGLTAGGTHKTITSTTNTHSGGKATSQSLSQSYEIVEDLKVAPMKKVRAVIKTWAVTYQADTEVKLTVDAKAAMPVHYRSKFSRKWLGGILTKEGIITAEDLFKGEDGFMIENDILTFTRKGKLSYLSEEVEITKEQKSL